MLTTPLLEASASPTEPVPAAPAHATSAGRTAGHTRPITETLIVIPTYNERDNLEPIVDRVLTTVPQAHVLIVDDGSPDGTGQLADDLSNRDRRVHVMHRTEKAGLGAAYLAGFRWALDRGYDTVVEMDADGSHAPEQLPRLLDALDTADLALGSRYIPGGKLENWPRRRELLSRWGNRYAKLCLDVPVHDITGGYRAFRRDVLETLQLDDVSSQGYCFQVELAWRAHQTGYRVTEVPITFTERAIGESKMSGTIVREALIRITRWGLQTRTRRHHRPGPDATAQITTATAS